MRRRWSRTGRVGSLACAFACVALLGATSVRADWAPDGVDLTRPRILHFPDGIAPVQARLGREPYATFVRAMEQRIRLADGVALDDHLVASGRFKARAAKDLAFLYAIDRRIEGGVAEPFASSAERAAAGDRVRELLVNLFDRSRLAVPPPLGDWDRDISTSEELLQYATAYDTMLGAGYDFGADDAVIREKLTNLASELYLNYIVPSTAGDAANLHQNNHRSKTGAALATAGIVLAEQTPDPALDPDGLREPANWIAYGLEQVDFILRQVLVTADGAYAEGPFYLRFTHQNLLPFLRAWDRLVGGADLAVGGGRVVPSLWRHPLFRRGLYWVVDTTLPDGSFAAFDDGNVYRTHYYGLYPQDHPLADAFAWHWATGAQPFETDGNVDLAPDALVYYDDGAITPAPRGGSPTALYPEAGNAIFRSDWSRDGVVAIVNAEGDVASQFGRDRDGLGVSPESHEHAEPGSFLLHAFGERLALDPGYFTFPTRFRVNQPRHHNMILVDGQGPQDFFGASFVWPATGLAGRPPTDGLASLADGLDTGFLDAARAVVRYGRPFGTPPTALPRIERRFLFADDRYLVLADAVDDPAAAAPVLRWLLHGNGGGSSGGSFETTPTGGRWTIGAARMDGAFAFDVGPPAFSTSEEVHEGPGQADLTHTALAADVVGASVRGLGLVYPSPSAASPPAVVDLALPGVAALALTDAGGDRRVLAMHRASGGDALAVPGAASGLGDAESDGRVALFDAGLDGALRLAWAEGATRLAYAGATRLETVAPGSLGLRLGADVVEAVADVADPWVALPGLPFVPAAADGACALVLRDGVPWVRLGRERRFALRAAAGNAQPAADPGPDRAAALGELVRLDGRASCDADGDRLAPRWELVAAPPGSDWDLQRASTWRPELLVDRPGPYRLRLVVTDVHGSESAPRDVVVRGAPACANLLDEDLDGLFDGDDPDCDEPAGANRSPAAIADGFAAQPGVPLAPASGVLANDGDPDGDAVVAVLERRPLGELWLPPDGRLRYVPAPGFRGRDTFTYRVRDEHGAESAPVEVAIDVGGAPRDLVTILVFGGLAYARSAELVTGDLSVTSDAGGPSALSGSGTLEGPDGLAVAFDLVREADGVTWSGTVSFADPKLAAPPWLVALDGPLVVPLQGDALLGWSGFANPGLPPGTVLVFAVHDLD